MLFEIEDIMLANISEGTPLRRKYSKEGLKLRKINKIR